MPRNLAFSGLGLDKRKLSRQDSILEHATLDCPHCCEMTQSSTPSRYPPRVLANMLRILPFCGQRCEFRWDECSESFNALPHNARSDSWSSVTHYQRSR